MTIQSVCVFCGSRKGNDSTFEEQAFRLGEILAEENIRLVYGGGTSGIMGAVANGVLSANGKVTGVIPEFLMKHERGLNNPAHLDQLIITKDMHERKMRMYEHSDAFIALPGGIGTLEELVEQMTWSQLGQHQKPILVANFSNFWQPFFDLLDHMQAQDFIGMPFPIQFLKSDNIAEFVPILNAAHKPTARGKNEEIRNRM